MNYLKIKIVARLIAMAVFLSSFSTFSFFPRSASAAGARFPEYKPERLDNSLEVIVHEDHELPIVSFRVMIKAGSAMDPAGKEGLANFTSNVLTEGTETRSAREIAEAIDFVGGSLSSSAGYDASYISCDVLTKDLELALDILSDVILHPSFPGEEVERQRSQIITSIVGERDNKSAIANKNYQELLFGGHPYSHQVNGLEESVEAITRDDIAEFYETYYRPNISVMVITGDVKTGEVLESVRDALGTWKSGIILDLPPVEAVEPEGYRIRLIDKPDLTQSEIRVGYLGIRRNDPDYFPMLLMNYTLGGGGFSSRLMASIRGEKGLTYGVNSHFSARVSRGSFTVSTFTKTATTLETIQEILKGLEEMKRNGITPDELKDAKARYTGGFPLTIETPAQISGRILEAELYDLGEDYFFNYTTNIDHIDIDQVNALASRFLRSQDLVIVVVGNADLLRDDLKTLGDVEEVYYLGNKPEGEPPHEHHH